MTLSLSSPQDALQWCDAQRNNNLTVGFVPTMGALHAGHCSLVSQSVQDNDLTCVSIFVNPLQFNNASDLEKYPRNRDQDIEILSKAGCDMVFTGTLQQFFPGAIDSTSIALKDPGPAGQGLEGKFRPGHLEGVVTIVERLFKSIGDCNAYFGEKDFQQTLVVKHLAEKLKTQELSVVIKTCPTIRETSGLAMSSRNERLTTQEFEIASKIFAALSDAKNKWNEGVTNPIVLERNMQEQLIHPKLNVEYAAIRDQDNWTPNTPTHVITTPRALIAAYLGEVRLIDNLQLNLE